MRLNGEVRLAGNRARVVRLRRSDVTGPGIQRIRSGRGFRYLDADGRPVPPQERDRIARLVIPPAWKEVWICPWPNGHIQAVGFDAAGRRRWPIRSSAGSSGSSGPGRPKATRCSPTTRTGSGTPYTGPVEEAVLNLLRRT